MDFEIKNISHIPETNNKLGECVYMLYKDDAVVYVGRSKQLKTRLNTHKRSVKDFNGFSFLKCEDSRNLEGALIIKHSPIYNTSKPKGRGGWKNTFSIHLSDDIDKKLKDISDTRKELGMAYKTKQDVIADLINKAHKREVK